MKTGLIAFALCALLALVGVSAWATSNMSIVPAIQDLLTHAAQGTNPWFVATLFDAYFAFLWIWLWVAYKETSWGARLTWLLLILALGNMAIAAYVLLQVLRLPPGAGPKDLLLRRA